MNSYKNKTLYVESLYILTLMCRRGLPIDRARHREKGQPLCMEQYYRLFSSYREPGVEKDKLRTSNDKSLEESDHVIVMCRNKVLFAVY